MRLQRPFNTVTPSASRPPNSGVLRIQHELNTLMRDPVPFIYVYADESNITKISALVIGPLETPYAGGFFRFDMRVGSEYPMKAPTVILQTTDGGRVRFNPNLYNDGKVCLSILGTWTGPAWSSAESLSSVLLSIQSLMCPQPYHNEPGYETRDDKPAKAAYNDYLRYETLRVAVVGTLKHTSHAKQFPDVCERLFLLWHDMYMATATDLMQRLEGKTYKDAFSSSKGTYNLRPIIDALKSLKKKIMERMECLEKPQEDSSSSSDNVKSSLIYAVDRLQDEHRILSRNPHPGGSASPRDPNSPFVWDATILGPNNTPWEGGFFALELRFSYQHPYRPPFAKFTSKMHHPNITRDGIPALDLIQTRWNPNTRVGTILDALQEMLKSPSSVYPVNVEVASQYRQNVRDYERKVRRLAADGC
ncbi:Ubiquitin-conjugating enzyme E2 Z [Gracilariopsis chorda]|uniref:Ubiquitin-conjugating enzyme E2 Z n=1 Tax=Gracilariopsis chorda TaxID=448386 RepID=A0A2V3J2A5_9FLOR|nr:Ubiquitin-conjugating enzyme E2 Z [Gracilariopsis chorda]|eukprot:PXF48524.1 Ubiquitin-conjugating enzyme E2 Z [Gracilariopsis chorda]